MQLSSASIATVPTLIETTNDSSLPPALPPKRSRSIKSNVTYSSVSPKPTISMQSINNLEPIVTSTPLKTEESTYIHEKKNVTPSTPVKLVNINVVILQSYNLSQCKRNIIIISEF